MPFTKPKNSELGSLFDRPEELEDELEEVSWGQATKAALQSDTTLGAFASNKLNLNYNEDSNFDVVSQWDKLDDKYKTDETWETFANAKNETHFKDIQRQIDFENSNRQLLGRAGAKGILASIGAQFFDPINFVPFAGVATKSFKVGKSIAKAGVATAAAGAVTTTAQEAIIHSQQQTRTVNESLQNIAADTILGGILGAGLHAIVRKSPDYPKLVNAFSEDVGIPPPSKIKVDDSAGAKALAKEEYMGSLEENVLTRGTVFKKTGITKLFPNLRLLESKSLSARYGVQQFSDTLNRLKKHEKGIASPKSVESMNLNDIGDMASVIRYHQKEWVGYLKNTPKLDRVTRKQFDLDVATEISKDRSIKQANATISKGQDSPYRTVVQKVANEHKKIYQFYRDKGIKAKLFEEGTFEDYLPQYYNTSYVIKHQDRFKRLIKEYLITEYSKAKKGKKADILESSIEDAAEGLDSDLSFFTNKADEVFNNIVGTRSYSLSEKDFFQQVNFTKERKINLPRGLLQDFLINDPNELLSTYVKSMSPRINLINTFGKDILENVRESSVIRDIVDDYTILRDETPDIKAKEKLVKQQEKDIKDLVALRDKLLGSFGRPADPYSYLYRAKTQVKQLNVVTLLGDVVGSSIPDVGKLIINEGFTKFFTRGLRPFLKQMYSKEFRVYFKKNIEEVRRMGIGLDVALSDTTNKINDIADDFSKQSKIERGMTTIGQAAMTATGIKHWNTLLKTADTFIVMGSINDAIVAATKGKASKKQISMLAKSGIDKDMSSRMYKQLNKFGKKESGMLMPEMADWDDSYAASMFSSVVRKEVDSHIVTPGVGDRPNWLSKQGLDLFGQFQSFGFSSIQRTLIPAVQDFDLKTVQGLTTMVALGMVVAVYKRAARGDDIPDIPTLVQEGVDRSGVLGFLMDTNSKIERVSKGNIGISRIFGTNATNKYYNYTRANILGPTTGKVQSLYDIGGDILSGDMDSDTAQEFRTFIPLQNMVGVRELLDKMSGEENNLVN